MGKKKSRKEKKWEEADALTPPVFDAKTGKPYAMANHAGAAGELRAESPAHDEVGVPSFAAGEDTLSYGVRDGRELIWVTLALP